MKISLTLTCLVVCLGLGCYSQTIDSLKQIVLSEKADSVKPYQFRNLSYEYLSVQELDSCFKYARLGKMAAIKNKDRRAEAYNLEMEGNISYYHGLYERSMNIFTSTLETGEQLQDTGLIARSYSMMGWIYIEQRRFENALAVILKALKLQKEISLASEELALDFYCIASVYAYTHSTLHNLEMGAKYYDSALALNPGLRIRERAFVLAERGAIFKEEPMGFRRCEEYLLKALQLVNENNNHLDTKAYILAELSDNCARFHQREKARQYALAAARIYSNLPFNRRITSVYQLLAETFESIGDLKMALQMERLYGILSDSIFDYQSRMIVEQTHQQYEDEKKQAEIERLKDIAKLNEEKEISNRRTMWIIEIASALIVALTLVVYFNRNRYLQKIQALKLQQTLRGEKDKIARDLHDSLGGQLSSISIGLNRLLDGNNGDAVQIVQDLTDKAIAELRNSLWVMDKEFISISELEQRINSLFWQYRKIEVPMDLQLSVDEVLSNVEMSSSKAGHLFRIIQEATNNSIKHSRAAQFKIGFEKMLTGIYVTIVDNGVGFDNNLQEGEHYGMKNMRKRAEQMKATLNVESSPGNGVKITVSLPLEKE